MNVAVVASASDRGGIERLAVRRQPSTTGFLKVEACSAAFSGRLRSMEAEIDRNLQSNSR